jgi:hypothetical protein
MPRSEAMPVVEFWDLMESAKSSVRRVTDVPNWMMNHLMKQSLSYIASYHKQFHEMACDAYDARLWAAAGLMLGYCSDDRFYEFRAWLIAHGRVTYENALRDPDTLAELNHIDGDRHMPLLFFMSSTAERVFREKSEGGDLFHEIRFLRKPILLNEAAWDGDQRSLRKMLPRLCAKFADDGMN